MTKDILNQALTRIDNMIKDLTEFHTILSDTLSDNDAAREVDSGACSAPTVRVGKPLITIQDAIQAYSNSLGYKK